MKSRFPKGNRPALIMITQECGDNFVGWTQARWHRAVTALQEQGPFTLPGKFRPFHAKCVGVLALYRYT